MKKGSFSRSICLIMAGLLLGILTYNPVSAANKTTLNVVSFVPKMNITAKSWIRLFLDKVNEQKGEVTLKYRGGPEVIAPFDLAKAVSNGVIDMAIIPTSFYPSVVPGADTMRLSEYSTQEDRVNGTFDLQREIHAKAGLYFLGNLSPMDSNFFWVVLRKPVKSKADFNGLKIGGSPPFLPCFKALGATPVKASLREYYPMVERGVIGGNIIGMDVYLAIGEYEVAPYVIDHPFYKATNVVIVNLKKWNKLSDSAKKLLTDVQIEYERALPRVWEVALKKMREKAVANGATFITLQPDVAEWFVNTFHEAGWKYTEEKFPKDVVTKFKKLITK